MTKKSFFSCILLFIITYIVLFSCFLFPINEDRYNTICYDLPINATYPQNNGEIDNIVPLFEWTSAKNILYYHIQISETSDFTGTLIADDNTLTEPRFLASTFLNNADTYYWRIRVKTIKNKWLDWSSTWNFTISVVNNIIRLNDSTPFFDWANINEATAYHIQISTNESFSSDIIIDDSTLLISEYQVSEVLNIWQHLYWRVRVKNKAGNWLNWSDIWSFIIILETKISDSDYSDYFGKSVSITADGNTILVGAIQEDTNDTDSGAVYIYKWNGSNWNGTKIIASDGDYYDWFGYSVAIAADGESFVVGSYRDEEIAEGAGAAYVYKWNNSNWEETKITAADGSSYDNFGHSVAISADGNSFVVGAYQGRSAYLYTWNSPDWEEVKIDPTNGSLISGVSMAANGNSFVIGASTESAYVYTWGGSAWNETKIDISDGSSIYSVSMAADGNSFVAGAPTSNSVYVYKWNDPDWNETKIIPSEVSESADFGFSVSITTDGNRFIVGAYRDDDNGNNSGSVYTYEWNGSEWDETKITASDGSSDNYFGNSISIAAYGNRCVVGAYRDDDNGSRSGSVYLYITPN